MDEKQKTFMEMAVALDEMEASLSSDNADFLDQTLVTLKKGKSLSHREQGKLERLYAKYFGDPDEEEESLKEEGAEEEVDDNDFM